MCNWMSVLPTLFLLTTQIGLSHKNISQTLQSTNRVMSKLISSTSQLMALQVEYKYLDAVPFDEPREQSSYVSRLLLATKGSQF